MEYMLPTLAANGFDSTGTWNRPPPRNTGVAGPSSGESSIVYKQDPKNAINCKEMLEEMTCSICMNILWDAVKVC